MLKITKVKISRTAFFCGAILGAVASVAQAEDKQDRTCSGFYAGVQASAVVPVTSAMVVARSSAFPNAQFLSRASVAKFSPATGLFCGYGALYSNLWLGGEVGLQIDRLHAKQVSQFLTGSGSEATLLVKMRGALKSSLHIGYACAPGRVLYAISGVSMRKFAVEYSVTNANVFQAAIKKKLSSVGFMPGIGFRFDLSANWSLGAEYTCALYKAKRFSANGTTVVAGVRDSLQVRLKSIEHNFSLRATRFF